LPFASLRVGMTAGPKSTGDRVVAVDPRRSLAVGEDAVTGRAEDRGDAAQGSPDRESSAREAAVRKNAVELRNSRGDVLRRLRPAGERRGVGKLLLDQCAQCGDGSRHQSSAIGGMKLSRINTESKTETDTLWQIFQREISRL